MLPRFRPIHCSILWRAIYVVCMVLVLSYVVFEVLDLDGSNFPSPLTPVQRAVIVAEVPSAVEPAYFPQSAVLWKNTSVLFGDRAGEYVQLQRTDILISLPLDSARSHGYRVGLPRDSIADLSPSA